MKIDQKEKTFAFYSNLTQERQKLVVAIAKHQSENFSASEKVKRDAVMKNDLVRLLELRKYPEAQVFWTATEASYNRRILDARKSSSAPNLAGTGSLADDSDPYGQLAEIFNDYKEFTSQNALIQYHCVNGKLHHFKILKFCITRNV
jgi:hypothetical protein